MLTQSDKETVMRDFPNIKLSYENIIYKKVHNSDYVVAIPEGKKCFAWFTTLNEKSVCLIMELATDNQILDLKIVTACFSNDLAYGTILYGTIVYNSSTQFFYIEDIFSYKGCDIMVRTTWGEKLSKIYDMLKSDLKQVVYNHSFIVFGLPLMCKTNEEMEKRLPTINYKVDRIQCMLFKMYNKHISVPYKNYIDKNVYVKQSEVTSKPTPKIEVTSKPTPKIETIAKEIPSCVSRGRDRDESHQGRTTPLPKREYVFLVRPEIQNDIYSLYCFNSQAKEESHGTAHIPNFDTSAMMNKLFRNIKENDKLDALEESDDEEEFENDKSDKFVYLDRTYRMVCAYNPKFKKWYPVRVANNDVPVAVLNELNSVYMVYEKNKKKYC